MISNRQVRIIRALLRRGASQRQIARYLGISHGTVGDVAAGRRRLKFPKRRPPRLKLFKDTRPAGQDEEGEPLYRCRQCGRRLTKPGCLACQLEREKPGPSHHDKSETPLDGPIGVNLRGDARRRYEEVRAAKIAAGEEPVGLLEAALRLVPRPDPPPQPAGEHNSR